MADAFVRTLKRDDMYVNPKLDAQTVVEQLPGWLTHHNGVDRRGKGTPVAG